MIHRRKTIRRYNIPGQAHFLTFSCHQRLPLLVGENTLGWIVDAIARAKDKYRFALWAYVIMPDHAHLLVFPLHSGCDISAFLKAVKQSVARKARIEWANIDSELLNKLAVKRAGKPAFRFWQAGPGYDRNIRTDDELVEKVNYIHNNPVTRGLADNPQDWEWSSARWFQGIREVPLDIDDATFPAFARTNKFVRGTQ
ncbi:MAG: transposase [SAR324 cluster bacterium]|nr:transposase [SAR324 cluster bacterium]